jgi:outer membrane lipoprotein-sorting protein
MTDLQHVIGLLYRADWTRLSMSADVHLDSDRDLLMSRVRATRPPWSPDRPVRIFREDPEGGPPTWEEAPGEEPRGFHSGRARLLIAPGGRYRQEYGDEPSGQVIGSDGERSWIWHQQDLAPPPWLPIDIKDEPPLHQLLCPSELLSGFTLEVRGPVTACGRDAVAVVATPRASIGDVPRLRAGSLSDHLEVIVDAELGILLRYEETLEGQQLNLTELTAVVFDPPEAADRSRFAPPAGSRIGQDLGESLRQTFSGPGWQAAKTAAGLAAGGLGAFIRFAPHCPGQQTSAEDDLQAAMPPAEPAVLRTEGGPPPLDDLLYLLYRSGENPAVMATLHQWHDLAAMTARIPDPARAAGRGGVGYLIDSLNAVTHGKPVAHTVARVRVGGRDRYRVDYPSRPGRNNPKTIACDGEHRWQVFAAQTMVGPANPLPHDIANVVDSSWLLGCRLSGGTEISYRGRRAYQLSVAQGGDSWQVAPLLFFPAEVIVDADLGCLLRLISFAGDRPASWWELSGIRTEPVSAGEFRLDVPPGVRVVEETGNAFADAAAVMPGAAGHVVRTAADVVGRTSGAVSAARNFLDDLRGRNRS